ncbi:MAG: chorismate mutase [Bryobacteraceae bacterium]
MSYEQEKEVRAREELEIRRVRIDAVDLKILELLNERTRIVQEIGSIKQEANLPIYEPKREDAVYRNVTQHNGGPLASDAVKRVFERIIDEMRVVQRTRMEKKPEC